MRDIAASAGITAALVVRYFGSKEQLFAEAVAESFDLEKAFGKIERCDLGKAFADLLFSQQREDDLLAIMVRASMDPAVHPVARQLAQDRMLAPMAALIGGKDALWRASLILSLATGLWVFRFMLPLAPLTGDVDEADQHNTAIMFQRIIDNRSR